MYRNFLRPGCVYLLRGRYAPGVANQTWRGPSNGAGSEEIMDAKYNWIIDNTGIRMAINVAAFTLWLAACALLLTF